MVNDLKEVQMMATVDKHMAHSSLKLPETIK